MEGKMDAGGMLQRAISLALMAHSGQKDKHGAPYILHPLRVGLRAENDVEMTAGFLHDVIEDSKNTIEDLRRAGFPEEVLTIVDYLTKREGEEWK